MCLRGCLSGCLNRSVRSRSFGPCTATILTLTSILKGFLVLNTWLKPWLVFKLKRSQKTKDLVGNVVSIELWMFWWCVFKLKMSQKIEDVILTRDKVLKSVWLQCLFTFLVVKWIYIVINVQTLIHAWK